MATGSGCSLHFNPVDTLMRAAFAGLLLATFAGSAAWAQRPPSGGPPPAVPVEVESVRVERWEQSASAIASLKANESVVIKPEVAGRIKSIEFQEGQSVTSGQILFRLDAAEYEAQLQQTRSALRIAEITFNRAKDLRGKNLVSVQEYDESEAKVQELLARLALDEARLDKMTLKAPFAGTIGIRKVSIGAYVKEGDELVALEGLDPIKVDVRIPETYVRLVNNKQRFSLQVDSYPDEKFTGEVYAVDAALDPATRTILLRGRVPNTRGLLRPGMFAKVSVVLASYDKALVVSERAIVPMGDKLAVYRVAEGKAQQVFVRIGDRQAGNVLISSGLAPGDQVVTAGQAKLRDGAAVMVPGAAGSPGGASSPAAGQSKP